MIKLSFPHSDILTSLWASSSWSRCSACCTEATPSPRTSSSSSSSSPWWWWSPTGPGTSTSTSSPRTPRSLRMRWVQAPSQNHWKLIFFIFGDSYYIAEFLFYLAKCISGDFFDLSFLINYVIHTNYAKTSTFPHYLRLAKSVSSWPCSTAWWWCPSCFSTATWSCKERRSQSQG